MKDLPKNGPEWHSIRESGPPTVQHLSAEFNALLKVMCRLYYIIHGIVTVSICLVFTSEQWPII